MFGLEEGNDDEASTEPLLGSMTSPAPPVAAGRQPVLLLHAGSSVLRNVLIWVAKALSATCCKPVSMLVTRLSPGTAGTDFRVPTTLPVESTSSCCWPGIPCRSDSYWYS